MKKLICISVLMALAGSARAVAPSFTTTTPAGGQRGTEMVVTLNGARLDDTEQVLFYDSGIQVLKLEEVKDRTVRARIKIAPDCALGEHVVRLRTATGVSPMRLFYVGPFPATDEKEPNSGRAKAQSIPLGTTVAGTLDNEDVDYFVVEARKGERISAEMEGARLGRSMLDSYLAIEDAEGRQLAESDDTPLLVQDTFVSIVAPKDGKYFIQARDSSFTGGHVYRLHVGTFPRPQAVYPAGGRIGESAEFKFIGDPKGDFTQKIKLPAEPSVHYGAVAEQGAVAPSPNWIRVSPFPNVLEREPNDEMKTATVASGALPLAFNGIISKSGDADWFKFKAKKGQTLEFSLFGRRLGSGIDSSIQVFDEKGRNLGQNDDSGGADSYLKITMPADGDYYLKVWDGLNGGGPSFTYRVEVDEPVASVMMSIPDTARYDNETRKSIVVPRGNYFAILMNIARNNYSGELDLVFPNLPKGIKAYPAKVPAGQNSVPVVFEAAADAKIDGNFLVPVAKSNDPLKPVQSSFRHRVEWVRIQNDTVYVRTDVDKITAAVVKEVPFKVGIVPPQLPLAQNGALDLVVKAERQPGFDEPITIKMLHNPPGIGTLPDMVIAKGSNSVLYRVNATPTAQLAKWPIVVVGSARMDPKSQRERDSGVYVSSPAIPLSVEPAFVLGKLEMASTERGKPAKIVCKLEQKTPFEGRALVKLVGLPANTSAPDKYITKSDEEVSFDVTTDEKSPTGMHKAILCVMVLTKGQDTLTQTVASNGILRIDQTRTRLADAKTEAAPAVKSAKKAK